VATVFGDISKVIRPVLKVMMKAVRNIPFIRKKLDASTTIVNFIKDRVNGKKMKWQEVVDVACAVN